ncbi:hypothetical protein SDC9_173607 [bioreactor metagenome]|uniref:Uncharacterized protein n=1 Tax=bioreactor metagenome TaxID=1076179 RepID=A0A645GR77_9ZZZZ
MLDLSRQSGSDLELANGFGQSGGKGVVDAVLHQQAVGTHAGLTGVAVLRRHGTSDRGVEVGIVEHDEWGVAAKFQ